MQTDTLNWRRLALPLGFAFICFVLSLIAFRSFGGSLPLEASRYTVDVPLPQALNVVQGSDVQTAGIDIGKVVAVRREGRGAVATLELQPEYAPLRTEAKATVRLKSLLGEGYIEVAPGPRSADPVNEGQRLAARQVIPAVQLDEFLETFDPATRDRFHALFGGMSRALDDRGEQLNATLGEAARTTANLASVLEAVDAERDDLTALLANAGDVLSAAAERPGALAAAVEAGDAVLATTARRDRALTATVRALPGFLGQLEQTSATISAAAPDLTGAVTALRPVTPQLAPALTAARTAAPEFTRLFDQLPRTIAAGREGLPALTGILNALPSAFDALYPAARELIPFMDVLGQYSDASLVGVLGNGASFTNGRIIGPGGKVIARGGGAITVTNESIAGYTKRLPTSRSNPYVKPGGLNDVVTRGFLSAYDCRHTGNPLLVPPTGGGSPPCVVQGPWTFRGKSAFYPRLKKARP